MILNDLRDLENEVKVMRFYLGLCLILIPLCAKFKETSSNISPVLNDLSDLEKKAKVLRFNPGNRLALLPLCTTFGEDKLNISPDIEWKQSFICHRLK